MVPLLIVVALLVIIVFHTFVYHQYNYPWTAKIINKIPGPPGVFYFGQTFHFWNLKNEDRLDDIAKTFKTHGATFRLWFSGVPMVFISHADDYQTVLSSRVNSEKGIFYKTTLPWLGRGLLTSSGEKWHIRRKIITPTFHFSILQTFVEVFNRNTEVMMSRLKDEANKRKEIDLGAFVSCCTLDNVCETAMGTSTNAQNGEPNNYVNAVFEMGKIVAERLFSPIHFKDINFALSKLGKKHNRILEILHGFTEKVIAKCKESITKNEEETEDFDIYFNNKKLTFLKILLEKQEEFNLTDKDIREEVDTFMFEGHDTTSVGITWCLCELGFHQEILQKCYEEQKKIFGESQRMPTYKDVMSMDYLKRVIQESLRLHPSVPVISRIFDEDLQLKDYLVPAGTEITMTLNHLHRNPELYPDPNKFDPDRFLPEAFESRHNFAYVPFSAGMRNCVGQKFAMMELMIIVSSIVRGFHIETLNDRDSIIAVPEMTLRPLTPLRWKITPRV